MKETFQPGQQIRKITGKFTFTAQQHRENSELIKPFSNIASVIIQGDIINIVSKEVSLLMCDPYPSTTPVRHGAGKDSLELDSKQENKEKWPRNQTNEIKASFSYGVSTRCGYLCSSLESTKQEFSPSRGSLVSPNWLII